MKQFKITIGAVGASSFFITFLLYSMHRYSLEESHIPRTKTKNIRSTPAHYKIYQPMRHIPLDEIYKDKSNDYSFELENKYAEMIDTPGCQIPVAMINYLKEKPAKNQASCGKRAVFLKKIGSAKVHVMIKSRLVKKYLKAGSTFYCCYKFVSRSTQPGREHTNIKYTKCKRFEDGVTIILETDFINIKCFENDKGNVTRIIYNDVYGFAKKINITKTLVNCKEKYNVLMLGMDSMSLSRFTQTMTRTVNFMKDNFWPGYRGFHKVGDNTFPNLMATFTGKNISAISKECSGKMDECNDLLIWSTYKEAGYVTAYGEDYLKLPDTFSKNHVLKKQPTDHYMRPLFLSAEYQLKDQPLVCAGKESSGQQILNYALDFANTYRDDSFFGVFWINSYSHNMNSRPKAADKMFENFFNQLTYTGVLTNTFVIFFSDHGIRFGEHRLKVESYYDERMPFLFVWAPFKFRGKHPDLYNALAINQFRLVTPYDLYNSLVYINRMATCHNTNNDPAEGCPNCQSLFEVISANRTCRDVAIHDKWCSCHKLYPLDVEANSGVKSVLHVVSHIQAMIKSTKTQQCWGCMALSLKKVHRIHFYYDRNNLHYVVAFQMTPGNLSYEATLLQNGKELEIVGPVSSISGYRGLGKCTLKLSDRVYCVCQKVC